MRSLIIPRLLRHASGIKRREPFMPRVHSRMFKKATVSPARPGTPRRAFPRRGRNEAHPLRYVEPLSEARTKLGKGRVLARLGIGGCKGFFNILCHSLKEKRR